MTYTTRDMIPYARLLFDIKHSTLDDCWLEGYEASKGELDEEHNPYPVGTQEYQFWSDGWWAECYGEEPLFQLEGGVNPAAMQASKVIAAEKAIQARKRWLHLVMELMIALVIGLIAFEVAELII